MITIFAYEAESSQSWMNEIMRVNEIIQIRRKTYMDYIAKSYVYFSPGDRYFIPDFE